MANHVNRKQFGHFIKFKAEASILVTVQLNGAIKSNKSNNEIQ